MDSRPRRQVLGNDKTRVEALTEHLRQVLDDPHLTIKQVLPGSVRLIISSSERAVQTMGRLIATSEEESVLGQKILGVQWVMHHGIAAFAPPRYSWGARLLHLITFTWERNRYVVSTVLTQVFIFVVAFVGLRLSYAVLQTMGGTSSPKAWFSLFENIHHIAFYTLQTAFLAYLAYVLLILFLRSDLRSDANSDQRSRRE